MQLRHEYKHYITHGDFLVLKSRLSALMETDPHAGPEGTYTIRSLYFDTPSDRILREKLDGLENRTKFRIRCYNNDFSFIRLEKKIKWNSLGTKEMAPLTIDETASLIAGNTSILESRSEPVLQELNAAMKTEQLRPKTLIVYDRIPFLYGPGNVRVTLDYHIRTGLQNTGFLDPATPLVSVPDSPVILEVKYDNFLPEVIRNLLQLGNRSQGSYSKYAAGRSYDF